MENYLSSAKYWVISMNFVVGADFWAWMISKDFFWRFSFWCLLFFFFDPFAFIFCSWAVIFSETLFSSSSFPLEFCISLMKIRWFLVRSMEILWPHSIRAISSSSSKMGVSIVIGCATRLYGGTPNWPKSFLPQPKIVYSLWVAFWCFKISVISLA